MSHVRIKQSLPKTQQEVDKTIKELNEEFNVDFTSDPSKALGKLSDYKMKEHRLKHYPQIPVSITEDSKKLNRF